MNKYLIDYYQCTECQFVQTEPTYWLKEAYENSMNYTDTGIMKRNERFSKITTSLIVLFFNTKWKFLDYAGGYGVFTRIMRDIGLDFYWTDPYTENVLSKGFEQKPQERYDLVTTFESFEHFENPLFEIENILKISKNVIFSTEMVSNPLYKPADWWYYGFEHGQHIALYSKKALNHIALNNGLNYYNIDNVHVFTEQKFGLAGSLFLKFKYSKHILYILGYFFSPFFKTKTLSDMFKLMN